MRSGPRAVVVHFLSGLGIGGKEAVALRSATRGLREGMQHRLLLYDTPFQSSKIDFDPGDVITDFLARRGGIDIGFALKLSAYLKDHNPKIVHAYNDTAIFYAALARLIGRGNYKIIGAFHTWPSYLTTKGRYATRWACRHIDKTIAVSSDLKNRIIEAKLADDCDVIPNGVDLNRFKPMAKEEKWRSTLAVDNHAFLVGNVARFDHSKRQDDLIDAARILAKAGSNVIVVFVGNGPLLKATKLLAQDCANIRFVAQTDEIPSLLTSLDSFALCSLHEGAPLAVLEAMACGLPIVATQVGGIPEMVGQGLSDCCALLVSPRDPQSIASALARLESSPNLRNRLSENALTRARSMSVDEEWKAYRLLYASTERSSQLPIPYLTKLGKCFWIRLFRSQ